MVCSSVCDVGIIHSSMCGVGMVRSSVCVYMHIVVCMVWA